MQSFINGLAFAVGATARTTVTIVSFCWDLIKIFVIGFIVGFIGSMLLRK